MKFKLPMLLIFILLMLATAGCNNEKTNTENDTIRVITTSDNTTVATVAVNNIIATTDKQSIEVDKNLLDVELTLPASFFEGLTLEEIKANAEKDGIKEVKQNDNGSVTYKMTKAKHLEMLEGFKVSVNNAINNLISSEDTKNVFTEVSFNDDYTSYIVKVNDENYNDLSAISLLGLNFSALMYQQFNGVSADKMSVTYRVVDASTGSELNSGVYPPVE